MAAFNQVRFRDTSVLRFRGGAGDDGFIQRFQVMVWPDFDGEWRLVKNPNLKNFEEPIYQLFDHLDKLEFAGDGQPVILPFEQDAQEVFDVWQGKHENSLRKGGLPPHLEAHFAKYKKLLPALCLILEHLKSGFEGKYPDHITKETLEEALVWLEYFESHAWRIYGSEATAIPSAAKNLIDRVKRGEITTPFSARDIYHKHHWSGLSNAEEVSEVLDYLIEKNCAKSTKIGTGGCPSVKYALHPKVLEG